ncbi:helix-turn-helix transcriptional regulator [Streptomyces sp. NPDC050548]|uniref:helix-turn-helix transcriptional regulator n=1 Tax=Streptomyces sp. NPDC050548 TaxID=3365629 RepID=UPI00378EC777
MARQLLSPFTGESEHGTGRAPGGAAEGERPHRRRCGSCYGDQLSPREGEVVRLLLTGLTNPAIARALSRSPKTVAVQPNSAMRTCGVTSRTALSGADPDLRSKPSEQIGPVDHPLDATGAEPPP